MPVSDPDDAKTPIDQAIEVLVYLPIGLVLDFPRSMPRYIERGRQHLDTVLRIGHEMLPGGLGDPVKQIENLQAQTRSTLRALGVAGPNAGNSGSSATVRTTASPSAATNGNGATVTTLRGPLGTVVGNDPAATASAASAEATGSRPTDSGIDPETLAIPDYDSLSASQVVPRLDGLEADELEAVRRYESGSRGRKTILSKVAQLQAG